MPELSPDAVDRVKSITHRCVRWLEAVRGGLAAEKEDLLHEGIVALLQLPIAQLLATEDGFRVACRACGRAVQNFDRRSRMQRDAEWKYLRARAYERPALLSREYRELREDALSRLDTPDAMVFSMFLDGEPLAEIARRCSWVEDAADAQRVLDRITLSLRNPAVPPERVRMLRQQLDSVPVDTPAYQRGYYARKRALASANRERLQRLHQRLRAAGYNRHGLASSGASAYYVHADGFRIRLSDHEPRSDRRDVCQTIRLDRIASDDDLMAEVERLHTAASQK